MLKEKKERDTTTACSEANENLKALFSFDYSDSFRVLSQINLYLKWKNARERIWSSSLWNNGKYTQIYRSELYQIDEQSHNFS